MPELPEVEAQRRSLVSPLVGAMVARVEIVRADVCDAADERGKSRRPMPSDLGEGAVIERIERLGKQMAMVARDGRVVSVHLGMTGMLHAVPEERALEKTDHVHVRWTLVRGDAPAGMLVFRDPRRFGGVWTFPSETVLWTYRWAMLGPDALGVTGDALAAAMAESRRVVKAALLDQRAVAGIGNIYADEALHRARVSPLTRCVDVPAKTWGRLAAALRATLEEAVVAGGSTLRDGTYTDSAGKAGTFQTRHAVYGRGGEPCRTCGTTLRSERVTQRTTVWCPRCQRT